MKCINISKQTQKTSKTKQTKETHHGRTYQNNLPKPKGSS